MSNIIEFYSEIFRSFFCRHENIKKVPQKHRSPSEARRIRISPAKISADGNLSYAAFAFRSNRAFETPLVCFSLFRRLSAPTAGDQIRRPRSVAGRRAVLPPSANQPSQAPAAAPAAMPRYCRLQVFRLWPCHRRLQLRRLQVSGLRLPRRQCRNAVRAATAESSSWRPLTLPSHGKAPPGCGHTPFRSASGADVPPPAPSPSRRA